MAPGSQLPNAPARWASSRATPPRATPPQATPPQPAEMPATPRPASVPAVLARLATSPAYLGAFLALSAVVALAYSLLLTFAFTQRFSLANWHYLTGYYAAWSVVLGAGMALVLTVQVYAVRQVARTSSGAVTGLAFVASLLPSFLCCTPVIPTLLAFVGLSTVDLYGTTGTLQRFFAVHETEFLTGSLLLLVATGSWALRRVARASCLGPDGCALPAGQGGDR